MLHGLTASVLISICSSQPMLRARYLPVHLSKPPANTFLVLSDKIGSDARHHFQG
ncbi:hypothetical protein BaRGS_00006921, partial [Batillaria attramentaria]